MHILCPCTLQQLLRKKRLPARKKIARQANTRQATLSTRLFFNAGVAALPLLLMLKPSTQLRHAASTRPHLGPTGLHLLQLPTCLTPSPLHQSPGKVALFARTDRLAIVVCSAPPTRTDRSSPRALIASIPQVVKVPPALIVEGESRLRPRSEAESRSVPHGESKSTPKAEPESED